MKVSENVGSTLLTYYYKSFRGTYVANDTDKTRRGNVTLMTWKTEFGILTFGKLLDVAAVGCCCCAMEVIVVATAVGAATVFAAAA